MWMVRGEWRAHPARAVLAGLAIAVGVALGFAVHLVNASALNEFASAMSTVNGEADVRVAAAGPGGVDEWIYPRLVLTPGVAQASPVIEVEASGPKGMRLRLIGVDPLRAAQVTPALLAGATTSLGQSGDVQAVALSGATMGELGLQPGQPFRLSSGGRSADFVVGGRLNAAGESPRIGVADIAQVQWRLGRLGRITRLDLKLQPGADPAQVAKSISAWLPADAQITTVEADAKRTDALSRAYRVNLDMLALVALMTGGFLVYSAQSLAIARRRPQFALLRVLGVERRGVLTMVLAEAAIVGAAGSLAGLLLGLALAAGALSLFGGDLGGGYFSGARPALSLAPGPALVFFGLGLAAALAGGLWPAREAARAQPAVALKNLGDAVDPRRRPNPLPALALLAAGAAAAFAPAINGLPLFGYLSIALLLAGGVAATPWLARALLAPVRGRVHASPAMDLALKRLWGAPSQAAVALCSIVASTSLVVAMAVMVASFRGSVDEWLGQVLPADVYLRVEGGGLTPTDQTRIAQVPGVARADFLAVGAMRVDPAKPDLALLGEAIDPADPAAFLPLIGRARRVPAGETPAWVSEPASWIYGWRAGDRIVLPVAGGHRVFVAGVWRDYARQHGAVALTGADYTRLTGDATRTAASITLAPGAEHEAVMRRLRAATSPALAERLTLARPAELRRRALATFDRSFAVTYLLEGVAVLVGLAGVAAALSAQTLARTKEFGMLRHLGVTRSQIIAMLAAEGALLGVLGVVAGVGLGLAMSQVLIHVVNPQSFHWTMRTQAPFHLLAGFAAALVAAAAGTALIAGRRALSTEAVQAVREDW